MQIDSGTLHRVEINHDFFLCNSELWAKGSIFGAQCWNSFECSTSDKNASLFIRTANLMVIVCTPYVKGKAAICWWLYWRPSLWYIEGVSLLQYTRSSMVVKKSKCKKSLRVLTSLLFEMDLWFQQRLFFAQSTFHSKDQSIQRDRVIDYCSVVVIPQPKHEQCILQYWNL